MSDRRRTGVSFLSCRAANQQLDEDGRIAEETLSAGNAVNIGTVMVMSR